MPQYPHRPIVQALDRLTEQARRLADTLDTLAEEVGTPLLPDNRRRVVQWVQTLPGFEGDAQLFQQWMNNNTVAIQQHLAAAEWKTTAATYSGLHRSAEDDADQLRAALCEVLDQFAYWPKGGAMWPSGGVVARVSENDWERWHAIANSTTPDPTP